MSTKKFILQGPEKDSENYRYIGKVFLLKSIEKGLVATAFMNSYGATALAEFISSQNNLKKVEIFVGIGNEITTKQALEVLIDKNIHPFVVDTATSNFIFHPKVYIANNDNKARLVIGSANTTNGGLVNNVEASIYSELSMSNDQDKKFINSVYRQFNKLKKDYPKNVFQINSENEVKRLFDEGLLVDQDKPVLRGYSQKRNINNKTPYRPAMKLNTQDLLKSSKSKKAGKIIKVTPKSSTTTYPIKYRGLLWESKGLTERDLNIPKNSNTNPTGSMLLKKGNFNIDQRTYFRKEAFANEDWSLCPSGQEICKCKFRFIIKNFDCGTYELEVSHDPRTNTPTYNQNNSVTSIHWRDAKSIIAKEELKGLILRLYDKDENGVYTINIDSE